MSRRPTTVTLIEHSPFDESGNSTTSIVPFSHVRLTRGLKTRIETISDLGYKFAIDRRIRGCTFFEIVNQKTGDTLYLSSVPIEAGKNEILAGIADLVDKFEAALHEQAA